MEWGGNNPEENFMHKFSHRNGPTFSIQIISSFMAVEKGAKKAEIIVYHLYEPM